MDISAKETSLPVPISVKRKSWREKLRRASGAEAHSPNRPSNHEQLLSLDTPCNSLTKSACRSFTCYGAMSLDPPTYLSSLQNNIRARPIPWEGAVRAGTITDNDLKTIKAVDKVRKEQRRQTVESDVEAYQSLILGGTKGKSVLESASKRADVIQYMLVLTGDLINGNESLSLRLFQVT